MGYNRKDLKKLQERLQKLKEKQKMLEKEFYIKVGKKTLELLDRENVTLEELKKEILEIKRKYGFEET